MIFVFLCLDSFISIVLKLIHVVTNGRISIVFMNNIPSYKIYHISLCIHPVVDTSWVPSLSCCKWLSNKHWCAAVSFTYWDDFLWLLSVERVGYKIGLLVAFWGTSMLFPIEAILTYFSPRMYESFLLLHFFCYISHSNMLCWYLHVVLLCMFLMSSDVKTFLCTLWPFMHLPLRNACSDHFSLIRLFVFVFVWLALVG